MRSLGACSLVALVVGCATATPPGADDDDPAVDARLVDASPFDAPPADAPIRLITLSQTGSANPQPQASVACTTTGTGVTRENSYYRAFRLTDFGITRPFTPTTVNFSVELAGAGMGLPSQLVQVRLHTLVGEMLVQNLTNIASANHNVPNSNIANITVPITGGPMLQSDVTLVAEVLVPDGDPMQNVLFVGANMGTETQPGYLRAPLCGINEPTTFAAIGFPQVKLILEVVGTY
jgi:hypothetical protein